MTFLQLLDRVASGEAIKAEEVQVLERLRVKLHKTNSYLSSLFTGDFVAWVRTQLCDDIAPDMWGTLGVLREQNLIRVQALEGLVNAKDARIEAQQQEVVEANERADKLASELEAVKVEQERGYKVYSELYDEWQKADGIIREVADEAQDAWLKSRKVDPEAVRGITASWFK